MKKELINLKKRTIAGVRHQVAQAKAGTEPLTFEQMQELDDDLTLCRLEEERLKQR